MKPMKRNLSLLLALFTTACGSVDDEVVAGSEQQLSAAHGTWTNIATCGDGQLRLDADADERRSVQVVIRDQAVIAYLRQQRPELGQWVRSNGELIFEGWQERGLFSFGDFGTFDVWGGYDKLAIVRSDFGGIKVALQGPVKLDPPRCTWVIGESSEQRVCQEWATGETANWWFGGCR